MAKSTFTEEEVMTSSYGTVTLRHNMNCSFDLPIGREVYSFGPFEEKQVPVSILSHRDFTDKMKKYFTIKEK